MVAQCIFRVACFLMDQRTYFCDVKFDVNYISKVMIIKCYMVVFYNRLHFQLKSNNVKTELSFSKKNTKITALKIKNKTMCFYSSKITLVIILLPSSSFLDASINVVGQP